MPLVSLQIDVSGPLYDFPDDAGQVVRDWRRRDGLTQEQLAHRAGMHQQAVARLEGGHQVPRVDTFARLLTACGAALRVERPLGQGVDRGPIRELLARPPAGRLLGIRTKGFGPVQGLRMLTWWRVSFVVVGPLAARLNGVPTPAGSIEICLARTRRNRERLGRTLRRLDGPPSRYLLRSGRIRPRSDGSDASECRTRSAPTMSWSEPRSRSRWASPPRCASPARRTCSGSGSPLGDGWIGSRLSCSQP